MKGLDLDILVILVRLKDVKYKILVLSGKGGVGKSMFILLFVYVFVMNLDNIVGIMDIDICGLSILKMMGVENEIIYVSGFGWLFVWVMDNFGVMSI